MVIKCTLSFSLKGIQYYSSQFSELPPLPEYMTKNGPYVNNKEGTDQKIIILYKFDRSKLREAWTTILKQMDSLHGIPKFTFSAHVLGKGQELRNCGIILKTNEGLKGRFLHQEAVI